jgi:hypothetical protein
MPESGAVAAVDSIIAMGDRVGTTTTEIWDEHFCEVSLFSPAEPIRSLLQGSIMARDVFYYAELFAKRKWLQNKTALFFSHDKP